MPRWRNLANAPDWNAPFLSGQTLENAPEKKLFGKASAKNRISGVLRHLWVQKPAFAAADACTKKQARKK
jgi:hypothetical protein